MPLEFNAETKARIQEILARYPQRQAALLPVLHVVQRELGYLSYEAQAEVARQLEVPPTLVREVTTFYEMFHEHPEGQFHLELCTNIACHLAGGDQLLDHLRQRLGVAVGHQTEDGMFSVMEAECLASCGSAPALRCGRDYYEFLTVPAVDALLDRFKQLAPGLHGHHYDMGPGGPHVGPVPGFAPPAAVEVRAAEGAAPPPAVPEVAAAPADAAPAAPAPEAPKLPSFELPKKKDDSKKDN